MTLASAEVGRHSELLAGAALIAAGYLVMEPTLPESFDLGIIERGDPTFTNKRVQVKTIIERERNGVAYYVIRGLKNSGKPYTAADCDYMLGIAGDKAYLTPCTGLTEYWCKKSEASEKWKELRMTL